MELWREGEEYKEVFDSASSCGNGAADVYGRRTASQHKTHGGKQNGRRDASADDSSVKSKGYFFNGGECVWFV